ncbi:hypothetical protein [Sphingomonas solaris]|uniref:Lipoprotein n=1 Tax=Alterirhizorhabdus solaris TaxID=2529389 RepID=A0A558QS24_9SPHN|nr:hypothetical protein [Sphingomonas solaris]TVV69925.1 hypothetical protein FOY91_20430 [Sphingomonas solaris]
MSRIANAAAAIALLAALAACDRKPADSADTAEALDSELANATAAARPATEGALGKQIVVDPSIAAGGTAPPRPSAGDPGQSVASADGKCTFAYDAAWAGKLPAELPIYPGARVTEAAGSDAPGCKRRIVSFAAAAPVASIIDFYRGRVSRAGYSAEHLAQQGSDVLGGTRGDAAYYISVSPSGAGSTVDLVANGG